MTHLSKAITRLAVMLGLLAASGHAAASCGGPADPCAVELGNYHAGPPDPGRFQGKRPAVLFFHGAGRSGAMLLDEPSIIEPFRAAGFVVLAPNGIVRPGRTGGSWSFGSFREPLRDEFAFAHEVIADAAARFDVDPARVLVSGYSIGGSVAWYLACDHGTEFAAFAPVAGAFWEPMPQGCAAPVKLLHTHGWHDQTVPLEGRLTRMGNIQGDVFESLRIMRRTNGCSMVRPDSFETGGVFWRRTWSACAPGATLEFAIHEGGHSVPPEWAPLAIAWFETVTARPDEGAPSSD